MKMTMLIRAHCELLFVLFVVACNAPQQSPQPQATAMQVEHTRSTGAFSELPDDFQIDERVFAWTTTFDVESGGRNYGSIRERVFSLARSFTYTDGTGAVASTARERLLSWGVRIDVHDSAGRLIGSVEEEVLKSLLKVYTTYSIKDAGGNVVAKSEKSEWLATDIVLYDNSRNVVATLHRPAINWTGDTWNVSIKDRSAVDIRLLVMIGAYKTAVDNDRDSSGK